VSDFVVERIARSGPRRTICAPVKEVRAQAILDAIRRWNDEYGEPPTLVHWESSRARRQDQQWWAQRLDTGDLPSTRVVRNHSRTLNGAISAAGLHPRMRGRRSPIARAPAAPIEREPARCRRMLALHVRSVAKTANREDLDLLIAAATLALGWADEVRTRQVRAGET
jgi:hypothetical protein